MHKLSNCSDNLEMRNGKISAWIMTQHFRNVTWHVQIRNLDWTWHTVLFFGQTTCGERIFNSKIVKNNKSTSIFNCTRLKKVWHLFKHIYMTSILYYTYIENTKELLMLSKAAPPSRKLSWDDCALHIKASTGKGWTEIACYNYIYHRVPYTEKDTLKSSVRISSII